MNWVSTCITYWQWCKRSWLNSFGEIIKSQAVSSSSLFSQSDKKKAPNGADLQMLKKVTTGAGRSLPQEGGGGTLTMYGYRDAGGSLKPSLGQNNTL